MFHFLRRGGGGVWMIICQIGFNDITENVSNPLSNSPGHTLLQWQMTAWFKSNYLDLKSKQGLFLQLWRFHTNTAAGPGPMAPNVGFRITAEKMLSKSRTTQLCGNIWEPQEVFFMMSMHASLCSVSITRRLLHWINAKKILRKPLLISTLCINLNKP